MDYESLGLICFECIKYGHRNEDCPLKRRMAKDRAESEREDLR